MGIRGLIVLFSILCYFHMLSAVNIDEEDSITFEHSLEAWYCSAEKMATSESYQANVLDVLDVVEADIMTHSSWDLMCRSLGGREDIIGCAGCLPCEGIKTTMDCYACILEARSHLQRRCPKSHSGSVFLKSCTLTYAPAKEAIQYADY
jgi:hypothetical protein